MSKRKKKEPEGPSEASLAASAMARARWAKVKPEERSRLLTKIGKLGGRPRTKHRCYCGQNTMRRAVARNFECCKLAGVMIIKQAS